MVEYAENKFWRDKSEQTLVDIPRLSQASGIRMLQNFERFQFDVIYEQNVHRRHSTIRSREETSMSQLLLMMTDGESALRCAKNIQLPENPEYSKPYASIDAEKEIGPVLNIGIAAVIDVPGVEVQVPPLSTPGCFVWILISRGHDRFVNEIHRHNSDIVNCISSLRTKEEKSIKWISNLPNVPW